MSLFLFIFLTLLSDDNQKIYDYRKDTHANQCDIITFHLFILLIVWYYKKSHNPYKDCHNNSDDRRLKVYILSKDTAYNNQSHKVFNNINKHLTKDFSFIPNHKPIIPHWRTE